MQKAVPLQGANGKPQQQLEEELGYEAGLLVLFGSAAKPILQLGQFAGDRFQRAREAPSGRRIGAPREFIAV